MNRISEPSFHNRAARFILMLAGLACLSGCEIRPWMTGRIISGEISKMREAEPHRVHFKGKFARSGKDDLETVFFLNFAPPETRIYTVTSPDRYAGVRFGGTAHTYRHYDPYLKRADVVMGLPAFNEDHYRANRDWVLRSTLEENRIVVETAGHDSSLWEIRVEPRSRAPFLSQVLSYVDKKTRTNLITTEYGEDGKVLTRFETLDTENPVRYRQDDLRVDIPGDAEVWTIHLQEPTGWIEKPDATDRRVPGNVDGLILQRARSIPSTELFDYSSDGNVLIYARRPAEGEILIPPVSKEILYRGIPLYMASVGRYIIVKWQAEGLEHMVVTNLAPSTLRIFFERVIPEQA